MPSYRTAFPSKYLRAQDATAPIDATIDYAAMELIGIGVKAENKLVVHFTDPTIKPFVLNMVNSASIAEIATTEDFELWGGVRIRLFVSRTEFQGKRVPCIRVEAPPVASASARSATRPPRTVQRSATPAPVDDIAETMQSLDDPDTF